MGECFSIEGDADYKFFYAMLHSISEEYPIVFNGRGSNKPHSNGYREFAQRWGFIRTLYDIAEKKIEKIEKIYQTYLNDFLQLLTFMIDEQQAEEEEDKFQEQLRKTKRGR